MSDTTRNKWVKRDLYTPKRNLHIWIKRDLHTFKRYPKKIFFSAFIDVWFDTRQMSREKPIYTKTKPTYIHQKGPTYIKKRPKTKSFDAFTDVWHDTRQMSRKKPIYTQKNYIYISKQTYIHQKETGREKFRRIYRCLTRHACLAVI